MEAFRTIDTTSVLFPIKTDKTVDKTILQNRKRDLDDDYCDREIKIQKILRRYV